MPPKQSFAVVGQELLFGVLRLTTASDWLLTFEFDLLNVGGCVKQPVRSSGQQTALLRNLTFASRPADDSHLPLNVDVQRLQSKAANWACRPLVVVPYRRFGGRFADARMNTWREADPRQQMSAQLRWYRKAGISWMPRPSAEWPLTTANSYQPSREDAKRSCLMGRGSIAMKQEIVLFFTIASCATKQKAPGGSERSCSSSYIRASALARTFLRRGAAQ
jgi:hypothetical protein